MSLTTSLAMYDNQMKCHTYLYISVQFGFIYANDVQRVCKITTWIYCIKCSNAWRLTRESYIRKLLYNTIYTVDWWRHKHEYSVVLSKPFHLVQKLISSFLWNFKIRFSFLVCQKIAVICSFCSLFQFILSLIIFCPSNSFHKLYNGYPKF